MITVKEASRLSDLELQHELHAVEDKYLDTSLFDTRELNLLDRQMKILDAEIIKREIKKFEKAI